MKTAPDTRKDDQAEAGPRGAEARAKPGGAVGVEEAQPRPPFPPQHQEIVTLLGGETTAA